jgi:hypothetical protein
VIVPGALFVPDAKGEHVDTLKHRAPTRLDLEEIVTSSGDIQTLRLGLCRVHRRQRGRHHRT